MKKKSTSTKIILVLAICLAVTVIVGMIIDRLRSVSDVVYGDAEDVNLIISEICAENKTIITDNNGKYSDYIEIYNQGESCNLKGFTISDGKTTSEPFDDMPLDAGEYKVIFLGKNNTGFALSSLGGETITLRNRDGSIVTQVTTVAVDADCVMSWHGAGYEVTDRATPGFENSSSGYQAFKEGVKDSNPSVVISEIIVRNETLLPDENGKYCDLVELHNVTDDVVSIAGYYISDTKENRFRYALPSISLGADEYLVVYCDGNGYVAETGEIHASFGITSGETIILTSAKGKYTEAVSEETESNQSLALADDTYAIGAASPGFPNDSEGVVAFLNSRVDDEASLIISEVLLEDDGIAYQGYLCDAVEIMNCSDAPVDTAGWYLTDSDDPYRYQLPSVILQPQECVVVVCDGGSEDWHANFSLSSEEYVMLTGPNWKHGVTVSCSPVGSGNSWNLSGDGTGDDINYSVMSVSIGYPNTDDGREAFLNASCLSSIHLSEAVSANTKTLKGPYGATVDWIELYNSSSSSASLRGLYLTDDPDDLKKGALPSASLSAGEYYVAFAAKSAENLLSGYPVMPFTLSSSGDCIYLTDGEKILDQMILPELDADVSYGRANGSMEFSVLASTTPGAANSGAAVITEAPTAMTAQGVYNNVAYVDVVLRGDGAIYYTTDCEEPTTSSTRYSTSIRLFSTTVIRAICVKEGCTKSKIVDLTYIINEGHTLAVASLVTTPSNLWDYYTGIYVEGPNASSEFPYVGANYWQQWEKSATVSLYETDGSGFSEPCGIRIFGAYSRALAMKSFSCFFRSKYGASSLEYALFGDDGLDSYEAFIFRNTGQDYSKARMRDPLLTGLTAAYTDVAVQKYRPVVLYLNGQFWGVYYIREKINENYIAGNYNVSKEDVTLTRANGTSSPEYQELMTYVKNHDLTVQENYDYVCSQVDIDEYIDYIIAEIIICNTDNGNIKFFKTTEGKWTWIMYDVDQSYRSADFNTVAEHLNPNGTGSMDRFSTLLINRLLKNETFKNKFLTRFAWQLNTIWTPENVNAAVDEIYNQIAPEMERDCEKWEHQYSDWKSQVQAIRDFAAARPAYVVKYVQSYFKLSDEQMKAYGFEIGN